MVHGLKYRGSPPRMRGKGKGDKAYYSGTGITPAYAGKSVSPKRIESLAKDHPRVCGEKLGSSCGA